MDCEQCRFYAERDQKYGECHRCAPEPIGARHKPPDTSLQRNAYWPIVGKKDWCGEFQPKT